MMSDFTPQEEEQLHRFSTRVTCWLLGGLSLLCLSQVLYVVESDQQALVFQNGHLSEIKKQPGLYLKWPLIERVEKLPIVIHYSVSLPSFTIQGSNIRPLSLDITLSLEDATAYWLQVNDSPEFLSFHSKRALQQFLSHPDKASAIEDLPLHFQAVLQDRLDAMGLGLSVLTVEISSYLN